MPCHKTCRILVPQPGIEPTWLPGKSHKKHVYMLFYDVNQGLANWSPTCFCMVCELKLCIFKWLKKIKYFWHLINSSLPTKKKKNFCQKSSANILTTPLHLYHAVINYIQQPQRQPPIIPGVWQLGTFCTNSFCISA